MKYFDDINIPPDVPKQIVKVYKVVKDSLMHFGVTDREADVYIFKLTSGRFGRDGNISNASVTDKKIAEAFLSLSVAYDELKLENKELLELINEFRRENKALQILIHRHTLEISELREHNCKLKQDLYISQESIDYYKVNLMKLKAVRKAKV